MFKSTSKGIVKVGKKPVKLTKEDAETIEEMFKEFSQPTLYKENGVWKENPKRSLRRT